MQDSFILYDPKPRTNKKKIIISLIGIVAVFGVIGVFYSRAGPQAPVQLNQVDNMYEAAFTKWTSRYNKIYTTEEERAYRAQIFRDNLLKIKQITEEQTSYTVAVNEFADLTQEEFKAKYLQLNTFPANKVTVLEADSLPDKIDWREKGAVTPVGDQGFCGSCWAFSAIGALEGLWGATGHKIEPLSAQQLVDCAGEFGNEGCRGGFMNWAFDYVQKYGIQTANSYQYKAVDQKCKYDPSKVLFKISGHTEIPHEDNDQLAAAVAQQPVSVAVQADSPSFQFYSSGVIDTKACGTQLNHGITAVGYDSTGSKPYWIVKNSWGASWGDHGYVKILKETGKGKGICGIAMDTSYPYL